jgi:DNA-binding transcriptional ArsR family regulator
MQSHVVQLDQIFQALSDQTRRAIIARLACGFCATSEHAKPFAMSLPSFIQHLNVLERSGLAASRKKCRVRIWELQRETLAATGRWLAAQNRIQKQRLDRLDAFLLE